MRFPSTLFGLQMTEGMWILLILIGAILTFVIVLKVFKNIIKDFASGVIIFILIIVFGFIFINILTGQDTLQGGFDSWFNNFFQ